MQLKPFVKYQLPFFLWIVCIFGLSSIPRVPVIKSPISLDKLVHIGLFFVMCWLGSRAFYYQSRYGWLKRSPLLGAFIFTILYGILDEVHQIYVPGRTSDVNDVLADVTGALLFALWCVVRRNRMAAGSERRSGGSG